MNNSSLDKGVPEAREALDQFKYEVANEIGVPLKHGYNGDLTSAQNGYVGGYMVNIMKPEQPLKFLRHLRQKGEAYTEIKYTYEVVAMIQ